MSGTGNDQRRAGFIDQDVVNLVDDGVMMPALLPLAERQGDIIAQIVKTKLAVGSIGDIRQISLLARGLTQEVLIFDQRALLRVIKKSAR